jgi:hypothetical protein
MKKPKFVHLVNNVVRDPSNIPPEATPEIFEFKSEMFMLKRGVVGTDRSLDEVVKPTGEHWDPKNPPYNDALG